MSTGVEFQNTSCIFGSVKAVDNVSFSINEGEFFSMLGPSGSGKTTCLRLIAGFEIPTSGKVLISGQDMTGTPPYDRDVNTVFQDYALFPHLSVGENIEYGLMIRKFSKSEREKRAKEMLELVRLPDVYSRKPSQLSGGQRQRIALARALINHPKVLLLDEPLGALDLKLREQMQTELKELQRKVGITFVFVTHDQEEALTMSDRVAVFNHGKIEQIGTPLEIYESPSTEFVANFVGLSNIFRGDQASVLGKNSGSWMIRPENIKFESNDKSAHQVEGVVHSVVFSGSNTKFEISVQNKINVLVVKPNVDIESHPKKGDTVKLFWADKHCKQIK